MNNSSRRNIATVYLHNKMLGVTKNGHQYMTFSVWCGGKFWNATTYNEVLINTLKDKSKYVLDEFLLSSFKTRGGELKSQLLIFSMTFYGEWTTKKTEETTETTTDYSYLKNNYDEANAKAKEEFWKDFDAGNMFPSDDKNDTEWELDIEEQK